VVLNPERVKQDAVPHIFKSWDIIWAPDMVDTARPGFYPRGSVWQGMNFFMVRPDLAVIDAQQTDLIRAVEKHGVDVLALNIRHARTLSGGFHCVTLDVRRRGGLEDYR
jgi:glycine amidinotransferase